LFCSLLQKKKTKKLFVGLGGGGGLQFNLRPGVNFVYLNSN
jgi:hypothetical protein